MDRDTNDACEMVNATCLLCGAPALRLLGTVANRRFRFTPELGDLPAQSAIFECPACGHIQKRHDGSDVAIMEALYANYNAGNFSPRISQAVFNQAGAINREQHVLARCADALGTCRDLLDIGCGPGTFLRWAGLALPGANLHGFDVTDIHRAEIMELPHVASFVCGRLAALQDRRFDCIVLWHSLEHMPDPRHDLALVRGMLRDHGKVLIQVPDVEQMPFDLAMFEHYSHFTTATLIALAEQAGFSVILNGRGWVHNCITLLLEMTGDLAATHLRPTPTRPARTGDDGRRRVAWLNAAGRHLTDAVAEWTGDFVIFGIGTAAGWLHGQLSGIPRAFVEEDPSRIGILVDTIPTISAEAILDGDLVILPFCPEIAKSIVARLRKAHKRLPVSQIVFPSLRYD